MRVMRMMWTCMIKRLKGLWDNIDVFMSYDVVIMWLRYMMFLQHWAMFGLVA